MTRGAIPRVLVYHMILEAVGAWSCLVTRGQWATRKALLSRSPEDLREFNSKAGEELLRGRRKGVEEGPGGGVEEGGVAERGERLASLCSECLSGPGFSFTLYLRCNSNVKNVSSVCYSVPKKSS